MVPVRARRRCGDRRAARWKAPGGGECSQGVATPVLLDTTNSISVEIDLTSGRLHGTLSNKKYGAKEFSMAANWPAAIGWIGFTGSTGGNSARHTIDDVHVEACR